MNEWNDESSESDQLFLSFRFRYGWCTLTARKCSSTIEIKATTIRDAFSDLLQAVTSLICDLECVSTIWGGEGDGYFLDMTRDGSDNIGLSIHAMKHPIWLSPRDHWTPTRGEEVFNCYLSLAELVRVFGREARRAKLVYADGTGYMEHWGWSFPVTQFSTFEKRAARFGYKPVAESDLLEKQESEEQG